MTDGEMKLCEWQYGMTGHFYTALFEAIGRADEGNLMRLAQGFPEEVEAWERFAREVGYWKALQEELKTLWPGMVRTQKR